MNLHEYQARALLKAAGVPMLDGDVATTPPRGRGASRAGIGGTVVVKAQVHAGGRGKAGGVKLAATPGEAADAAERILGMQIKGLTVQKVLVVPGGRHRHRERTSASSSTARRQRPVFMVSPAGGIDIEEVAAKTPEKILRLPVDPALRPAAAPGARARASSCTSDVDAGAGRGEDHAAALRRRSCDNGCSLAEINPLVTTPDGRGGRARRQDGDRRQRARSASRPRRAARRDAPRRRARWRRAAPNLTFIKLDGNVGCVVNGAGLAMATMDLVKYYGGEPANFLDIGGSSNPEKVVNALKIITADPEREGDPVQHLRRHHPHRRRGQRHRDRARSSSRSRCRS